MVAFGGIQDRAKESTVKSDLSQAAKQLAVDNALDGGFPAGSGVPPSNLKQSGGTVMEYTSDGRSYCLSAVNGRSGYYVTDSGPITEGVCPGHIGPGYESGGGGGSIADGSIMQTITDANCPASRIRAVDARGNRTYWVQRMPDGKCWMLTNLAYAGGGNGTHGDVRSLINGTGTPHTVLSPHYYIPVSGSNVTTEPAAPSISTSGSGQYGYLYNWCAANGGQATAACGNISSPGVSTSISVCPAGWRLPTGAGDGEYAALNTAVNGGTISSDEGLRAAWLAQWGGMAFSSQFYQVGDAGYYWTSTQNTATNAYTAVLSSASAFFTGGSQKYLGQSVRCVAA